MFTIGIMIVLIVALVWRKKVTEGFAFNVTGNNLGTDTTTYYIDVYYKASTGSYTMGPGGNVASRIVVDSRLKARLGGIGPVLTPAIVPPTAPGGPGGNITLNVGSEPDNLPINIYVYYATTNDTLAVTTLQPKILQSKNYTGYDLQVTGNRVVNGNLIIPTIWTTLAKSGFYAGNMGNSEALLARIYLTFLNSSITRPA